MIDKCANTACTERMVYLRSGVLYEVDILITSDTAHTTHFFWLCMSCSEKYDLRFSERGDPSLVPLDTPSAHDESTSDHRRIRRIFINQPPPGSTEATVDYADLERETPFLSNRCAHVPARQKR